MCLTISLDVSSNECVTIAHTLIKPCNDAVSLKQKILDDLAAPLLCPPFIHKFLPDWICQSKLWSWRCTVFQQHHSKLVIKVKLMRKVTLWKQISVIRTINKNVSEENFFVLAGPQQQSGNCDGHSYCKPAHATLLAFTLHKVTNTVIYVFTKTFVLKIATVWT